MKKVIFLFLLVCIVKSYSQSGYIQGIVIAQTDDTIVCLVPATASFGDKITIKKGETGNEEKLPLNKIKYLATAYNVFENVSFKKGEKEIQKLMWLKLEGKINLYLESVMNNESSHSYAGGTLTSFNPPTKTYTVRKTDTTFLVDEDNLIETLTPLISDNEELLHKVTTKVYKYENIETIIRQYDSLPEPVNISSQTKTPVPSQLFADKVYRKIVDTECEGKIFTKVETYPSIKGGESALADSLFVYLKNRNSSVKGKATFVFLVTKTSQLLDIEKFSGQISKEKDFIRGLLAYSNMWIPAVQNSHNVCVVIQLEAEVEKEKITLKIINNLTK